MLRVMPYIAISPCIVCGRTFSYNPDLVPSHPCRNGRPSMDPSDPTGPICATCITVVNAKREASGMNTWPVHPDAYAPSE